MTSVFSAKAVAFQPIEISQQQADALLNQEEGHFLDFKSKHIAPGKLTRHMSALANADGGELLIGVEQKADGGFGWNGFSTIEEANGHIQAFQATFPFGPETDYEFLACRQHAGLILRLTIRKSVSIRPASDGKVYLRRSAQSLPVDQAEDLRRLQYSKGVFSFETEPVSCSAQTITESTEIATFIRDVVPSTTPEPWLRKQQLIRQDKPTVAGILLFADEPQAVLPKRCGLKVYRYKTTESVGKRETLAFEPKTIEGPAYQQITAAVAATATVVQEASVVGLSGLESVDYPHEALHEIITNAIIHRDYSVADDIHIRVFDNRIEVESPGPLPAHITPENILTERAARNGTIVRLLNKYPKPPNKDVGEGLNTAFEAMRQLGLKDPIIENRQNSVLVIIRHERLASREELILEYLESNTTITNQIARRICHVDADHKIRRVFRTLVEHKLIEQVPNTARSTTSYRRGKRFKNWRKHLSPPSDSADASP